MAINGQSYTAVAGQIPMSAHIDFDEVGLREAQQPPLEAAGTRTIVSKVRVTGSGGGHWRLVG